MIQIDKMSRIPIYEQMIKATEKEVLLGILKAGERMPSVRDLSNELSVNPNTIQKVYQILDRRGIISTSPGIGTFITPDALSIIKNETKSKIKILEEVAYELAVVGISEEEVNLAVKKAYSNFIKKHRGE